MNNAHGTPETTMIGQIFEDRGPAGGFFLVIGDGGERNDEPTVIGWRRTDDGDIYQAWAYTDQLRPGFVPSQVRADLEAAAS